MYTPGAYSVIRSRLSRRCCSNANGRFIDPKRNAAPLLPISPSTPRGVRVIYFTRTAEGEVVLLTLYTKAKTDNLSGAKLKEIRRALEE